MKNKLSNGVHKGRCGRPEALSRAWIKKPYKDVKALIRGISKAQFEKVTNYIFHDAAQSIASMWYKACKRFVSK